MFQGVAASWTFATFHLRMSPKEKEEIKHEKELYRRVANILHNRVLYGPNGIESGSKRVCAETCRLLAARPRWQEKQSRFRCCLIALHTCFRTGARSVAYTTYIHTFISFMFSVHAFLYNHLSIISINTVLCSFARLNHR